MVVGLKVIVIFALLSGLAETNGLSLASYDLDNTFTQFSVEEPCAVIGKIFAGTGIQW